MTRERAVAYLKRAWYWIIQLHVEVRMPCDHADRTFLKRDDHGCYWKQCECGRERVLSSPQPGITHGIASL